MTYKARGSGQSEVNFSPSSGGLVSALAGSGMESVWIGWPGGEVKPNDRQTVIDKLVPLHSVPVFLSAEQCDLFYNGFCNDLLWPLFHYIALPLDSVRKHDVQYDAYAAANQAFADVVLEHYKPNDVVWIHDYHLMLLPRILREKQPAMKIGFFFHTPFPSSEIYRCIPSRRELLIGVLSSNLIGFHTHDYSRHFQSACTRIIGAQCTGDTVKLEGAVAYLSSIPIGIDPHKFIDTINSPSFDHHFKELSKSFNGRRIILGIDRLDYIKGIPHKLAAMERFLERNPKWVGKVVLVQIAVPSRSDVVEYQRLKRDSHEMVSRINGRFGSVSSVPIHYLDQSIPFERMTALYRLADVMLVTSIRDGMNLVAYEYVATQKDRDGILILSEFAGAAQSLGAGAIQINPWNISEVSEAILTSLEMSAKERSSRMAYCYNHVLSHTAKEWAREFVDSLNETDAATVRAPFESQTVSATSVPPPLNVNELINAFASAHRRVIITGLGGLIHRARTLRNARLSLETSKDATSAAAGAGARDYERTNDELWNDKWRDDHVNNDKSGGGGGGGGDEQSGDIIGTNVVGQLTDNLKELNLVPTKSVFTDETDLDELKDSIRILSTDPSTTYIIMTSRSRHWCDLLLSDTAVWCCAENGFFIRHYGSASSNWSVMYEGVDLSWLDGVYKIFAYFTERTPNSFISVDETSMQWHYERSEPLFAKRQALDLISHLTGGPLSNTATEVFDSNETVTVRPSGVTRSKAFKHILNQISSSSARESIASSPLVHGGTGESDDESHRPPLLTSLPRRRSIDVRDDNVDGDTDETSLDATANVLSPHSQAPIDLILCAGNYGERDEDLFVLLNHWSEDNAHPLNKPTPSDRNTPLQPQRRLSNAADTAAAAAATHRRRNSNRVGPSSRSSTPSRDTRTESIITSPTSGAEDNETTNAAASNDNGAPTIFTVTIGSRPSKAKYSLPNTAALQSIVIETAIAVHGNHK